jgi:hypothetical protein
MSAKNTPIEATAYTPDQFFDKISKSFMNQKKFLEHNKQLQVEAEINQTINSIQDFLDSYYNSDNTHYHVVTKEPIVIAKIILHFQKCGWKVDRKVVDNSIKLDFFPDS